MYKTDNGYVQNRQWICTKQTLDTYKTDNGYVQNRQSQLRFCYFIYVHVGTADVGTVVKALLYKSAGRWFDSRWCHWNFSLT
jgi:hypothetical protein